MAKIHIETDQEYKDRIFDDLLKDSKVLDDLKSRLKIGYDSLKADQPCMQWIFNYDIDDIDDPIHEAEKMAIENVKEYLKSLIDDIESENK